jgi:cob(I)alamin adenosyltransferase
MYDNSEQLSLLEAVIEHWDKYLSPLLQFILPEKVAFLASVGVGIPPTKYAPSCPR